MSNLALVNKIWRMFDKDNNGVLDDQEADAFIKKLC